MTIFDIMVSYISIIVFLPGIVVMRVNIPTIVTQMKLFFNFDHVTIISGDHIQPSYDMRELYKALKIQIVNKDQLAFSVENNCGFFIFGENIEDTKNILEKIYRKNRKIFFQDYWFINGLGKG